MRKTDKKEDILNAAMELLAQQGFHGAPMSSIAAHAGVGAGTIYHYFKNRDMLILEVHKMIYDEFSTFLKENYPDKKPIRERFFHIGNGIISYFIQRPLKYMYNEQFHHSPYGLEIRKQKLAGSTGDYDLSRDIYENGIKYQIIKEIPLAIFYDLAVAPIFWAVRDHLTGFVTIDDALAEMIVSACWDSIKI